MNHNFSLAIVMVLVIAFLLGYIYLWNVDVKNAQANAAASCKTLCETQLNQSKPLSSGPCLSEGLSKGWVCDVAHNPRQEIDNLPENQCNAFRNGTATHFIEVNETCGIIRMV